MSERRELRLVTDDNSANSAKPDGSTSLLASDLLRDLAECVALLWCEIPITKEAYVIDALRRAELYDAFMAALNGGSFGAGEMSSGAEES